MFLSQLFFWSHPFLGCHIFHQTILNDPSENGTGQIGHAQSCATSVRIPWDWNDLDIWTLGQWDSTGLILRNFHVTIHVSTILFECVCVFASSHIPLLSIANYQRRGLFIAMFFIFERHWFSEHAAIWIFEYGTNWSSRCIRTIHWYVLLLDHTYCIDTYSHGSVKCAWRQVSPTIPRWTMKSTP